MDLFFYYSVYQRQLLVLISSQFSFGIAVLEAPLRYKENLSCSYKSDGL